MERNFGEQPLKQVMARHNLKPHDLVQNSREQMTHKMVARAAKGRWLTPSARIKVLKALNQAAAVNYKLEDLFNYGRDKIPGGRSPVKPPVVSGPRAES